MTAFGRAEEDEQQAGRVSPGGAQSAGGGQVSTGGGLSVPGQLSAGDWVSKGDWVSTGDGVSGARQVSAVGRYWPEATVRITFGVILAVDAGLKWRPGFRASYPSVLSSLAQGQPHWLQPWFNFLIRLQSPHPAAWACFAALTESLLAAALIGGFARKLVYAGGAGYSLMVWATAGTFGGPYTPEATDIGPAIAYAVVFCALLTMSAQGLASRYSLDAVIARRVHWWHHLAEVRDPKAPASSRPRSSLDPS